MSTNTPDKRKALGRGIEALLPTSRPAVLGGAPAPPAGTMEIDIDRVDANPYQTRTTVSDEALGELAASIKANGVVQPIVVRPIGNSERFQLIAGQRRLLASKRAGLMKIPAIVKRVSDQQAIEITIVENLQREDLNPVEQAQAFHRLATEFALTQETIAQRTGKDRSTIANHLRLLKLPEFTLAALRNGKLSFGHGKVLLMLQGAHEMAIPKIADRIVQEGLSVRQTEALVHRVLGTDGAEAAETKAKPAKDPNVKAAESALKSALGCKVDIKDRGGKGKIVLQYATIEDFDRILDALGAKA